MQALMGSVRIGETCLEFFFFVRAARGALLAVTSNRGSNQAPPAHVRDRKPDSEPKMIIIMPGVACVGNFCEQGLVAVSAR